MYLNACSAPKDVLAPVTKLLSEQEMRINAKLDRILALHEQAVTSSYRVAQGHYYADDEVLDVPPAARDVPLPAIWMDSPSSKTNGDSDLDEDRSLGSVDALGVRRSTRWLRPRSLRRCWQQTKWSLNRVSMTKAFSRCVTAVCVSMQTCTSTMCALS